MSTPEKLRALIDDSLAPRINAHQTYLADACPDPFPVASTNLIYVYDEYHSQYLDFSAAGGVMNLGHAEQHVTATVREHLTHYLCPSSYPGEHVLRFVVEYAEAIAESFGDDQSRQVLFVVSEAEARQEAERLAMRAGKPFQHWQLVDEYGPSDPDHIRSICDAARHRGEVVIIDETCTGYGRLGTLWAQQAYGVTADITVLGGAGGGGFPFGAVVAPRSYFEGYRSYDRQAANPVICAAGKTILDQVTPPLLEHVIDAGMVLADVLDQLVVQFPTVITGHYGTGLHHVVVLPDADTAMRFCRDVRAGGLLLTTPQSQHLVITPPLVISESEIRRGVDIMAAVLLNWTDA